MRSRSLIFASSIAVSFILLLSSTLSAEPLRIWVMHNEPVEAQGLITAERIQRGIERLRTEGIIIENSVQNLMLAAETKNPLGAYVVERNGFLEELALFHRKESSREPIAVEFLRWDDAYNRITSAIRSDDKKSVPDIVQAGHSWIVELANEGRVADLSQEIDRSLFSPAAGVGSSAFSVDGFFAVPWFMEMRLLYFNRSLIDVPGRLGTWRGLLSAAREFDKEGKRFLAYPTAVSWNLLHNLAPWLWAFGGDIVRAEKFGPVETFRVAIDDAESLDAILYLKELAASGSVDFPAVSQEIIDREFRDGKYAVIITGPWITKLLGDGWRSRFGVAPMPAGPKGSFPFFGGSHLMVSEASYDRGNFKRAAALIAHLISRDSQLRFASWTGLYPANREALDEALAGNNDGMFRKAVEAGLAYPAMPIWGRVVENDFIRNHVWHIWRDISETVSDAALVQTVKSAAWDLRRSITIAAARKIAPHAGIAVVAAALLAGALMLKERRAKHCAVARCKALSEDLCRISAERKIIESRVLVMERRCEEGSQELAKLHTDLDSIQQKSTELASLLARARTRHPAWDRKRIGEFSIRSNGTLLFDGEEVKFENNRQARRFIEHMTRQACAGDAEVHPLWGYPLFGWEAGKIQTDPKRLFEAMAAKINCRLKALGKPPLFERAGRKSCSWRFFWDKDSIAEHSDIHRSQRDCEKSRDNLSDKNIKEACLHAIAALDLDPGNLDAMAMLVRLLDEDDACVESHRARIEGMLKISEGMLSQEIVSLKAGITAVKAIIATGRIPRSIDAQTAQAELMSMIYHEDYLEKRFEGIFRRTHAPKRPMLIDEITGNMQAVQNEIRRIKSRGASEEIIWASVVDSASFARLMSIPHIRSMVHNFYNHEIQSCEDPRLVQLALVSLLSSPVTIRTASEAKDERDLLTHIDRGLRKQLVTLEQQLGAMSVM